MKMNTSPTSTVGQPKITRKAYALVATLLIAALLLSSTPVAQAKPSSPTMKPGIDFQGPHLNLNIHGIPAGHGLLSRARKTRR